MRTRQMTKDPEDHDLLPNDLRFISFETNPEEDKEGASYPLRSWILTIKNTVHVYETNRPNTMS